MSLQNILNPDPSPMEMAGTILSIEEEAIVVDELRQDGFQMQQTADELSHNCDFMQGMEDMLIVANTMTEPADTSTSQLVDVVSELSTAGTDAAAVIDPTLATESIEGIKTTIKKIWDHIVALVKQFVGQIASVFNRYNLLFQSYEAKMSKMLEEVKKIDHAKIDGSATMIIKNAAMGGAAKTKPAHDWVMNWTLVQDTTVKSLYAGTKESIAYANVMIGYIKGMAIMVKEPDAVTNMKDQSAKFVDQISKMDSEISAAFKNQHKQTILDMISGKSKGISLLDLPGNYEVVFTTDHGSDATVEKEDATLHLLQQLSHGNYQLKSKAETGRDQEFNLPTVDDAKQVLTKAIGALHAALGYIAKDKKEVEKRGQEIQHATDDLVKQSMAATDQDVKPYVNAVMQLNKHFNLTTMTYSNQLLSYLHGQFSSVEDAIKHCLVAYRQGETVPVGNPATA